jgi:dinuclear metal center YbgI/SA1388 family protein
MRNLTNKDIFNLMENWAPKTFAYDWDNVGLQVGSYNKPVKKVMITLDVLEAVVDEAIEKGVDLIIAHHPLLFKPLKQLNVDHWRGRIIQKLIQHDISVYAAHTNLDIAEGGVNDLLADLLELENTEILINEHQERLYKIAVFTPTTHVELVMDAISKVGAGHIGDYSHCTFQTNGTGTFMPQEGTNPFIGKQNQLEKVNETKIETIVPESILNRVINAMISAHPYEEVAYDIYPLQNAGNEYGLGRIGSLPTSLTLQAFAEKVKKAYNMRHVRVTGNLTQKVKRVAVLGGSGEKYIYSAVKKNADVYVTGDMTFHMAQEALEMGLNVIDAGHYIEQVMKDGTKNYLEKKLNEAGVSQGIEIIVSEVNTDPFQYQ